MKLIDYPAMTTGEITEWRTDGPFRVRDRVTGERDPRAWAARASERITSVQIDDHLTYYVATVVRDVAEVHTKHTDTPDETMTIRRDTLRTVHRLTCDDVIACGDELRALKAAGVPVGVSSLLCAGLPTEGFL